MRAGETINIPAKRAALLHQRFQANGAAAVPLRTSRTGRLLRKGRCPGGDPDDEAAQAKLDKADQARGHEKVEEPPGTARSF